MVAASPCALAAAPLAYATAVSSCARKVYIAIDAVIKNLNSNVVFIIRNDFSVYSFTFMYILQVYIVLS